MKIITEIIGLGELKELTVNYFGNFIKAVVDIQKEIIAIDAELHSDLEALLLNNGSKQKNLWGINLYPQLKADEFIEFDSMINVRPSQGNMSRGVKDREIYKKIIEIVDKWIKQ